MSLVPIPSKSSRQKSEKRELELERRRRYYVLNRDALRKSARERAQQRKKYIHELSAQEVALDKEKHREAQARYREKNRMMLNTRSWQYRINKKARIQRAKDDEEYEKYMASDYQCEDDSEDDPIP